MERSNGISGAGIAAVAMAAAAAGVMALLSQQLRRPRRQSFAGRVVVITGGSRGFGLALARRFAAEGARLALVARDRDELSRAVDDLNRAGAADVLAIVCDVRDRQQVEDAVEHVLRAHGRIDVLVNNAGVMHVAPFAHMQDQDFRESIETHFWGPLFFTRAALRSMLPRREGHIVNISSVGGRVPVPHLSAYCAGKFALTGLSEALRMELAPQGIAVTTVTPFIMRTGSHRNVAVRGQHRKEALWFAFGPSIPVSSIDADAAAASVLDAVRDRRAVVAPGWQSRAAELVHHLAPEASAAIGGWLAEFVMPADASSSTGDQSHRSRDLDLAPFARWFPTDDARRFNQPIAADEHREPPQTVTAPTPEFAKG